MKCQIIEVPKSNHTPIVLDKQNRWYRCCFSSYADLSEHIEHSRTCFFPRVSVSSRLLFLFFLFFPIQLAHISLVSVINLQIYHESPTWRIPPAMGIHGPSMSIYVDLRMICLYYLHCLPSLMDIYHRLPTLTIVYGIFIYGRRFILPITIPFIYGY